MQRVWSMTFPHCTDSGIAQNVSQAEARPDLDLRPFGLDLMAQVPGADPHTTGQGEKIDPVIVTVRVDKPQSFLDPLDGRPPLPCLRVINPYAELEKDADEIRFVPHPLEKEILEQVAGFEAFTIVEQRHAANESRIGRDIHRSHRTRCVIIDSR